MNNQFLLEEVFAKPWEHRQQLQYFADSIAFSEEIPIRLFDKSKLDQLPEIFMDIAEDDEFSKIYIDANGRDANLKKEIEPILGRDLDKKSSCELLESFFADHFACFQAIWLGFKKLKNDVVTGIDINQQTINWNNNLKAEELKCLEGCRNEHIEHIRIYHKCQHALHFILQSVEYKIWLTRTSNAIPIHMMFRTDPSWRSLVLIWFYLYRNNLTNTQLTGEDKLHGFLGMGADVWYAQVEQINEHIFTSFAPVCRADDTTRRRTFFLGNGLKIYYLFRCFHEIFEDHDLSSVPSKESYSQAISKRALVMRTITRKRIVRALRTWNMLQNVTGSSRLYLKKLDCIMLATALRFIGHHQKELSEKLQEPEGRFSLIQSGKEYSTYYVKVNGCTTSWLSIIDKTVKANSKHDSQKTPNTIALCAGPIVTENYGWHIYAPAIKNFTEHHSFYLEEIYRDNQQRVNARIRNYNAFRLSILNSWIERHFGEINNDISSRDRIDLKQFICAAIVDLLRADYAIIWLCDYTNGGRLIMAGDFSHESKFMKPEVRNIIRDLMEGQYQKFLRGKDKLQSICYRVLSTNSWQIIEESTSNDDSRLIHTPSLSNLVKSALAVPIHFNGRLLGVIEVNGCQPKQFLWSQLNTLVDVAEVISPHLYHLSFVAALGHISAAVRQDIANSHAAEYISTLALKTNELICKQLNMIFLCEHSFFWLLSSSDSARFNLCASSFSKEYLQKKSRKGELVSYFHITDSCNSQENIPILWRVNNYLLNSEVNQVLNSSGGSASVKNNTCYAYASLCSDRENSKLDRAGKMISLGGESISSSKFPQRKLLCEEFNMRELLSFGVRASNNQDDEQLISAYFCLYSHSSLGFSSSWQSIINMVEKQLQVELAFLGVFESKKLQTNRLVLHEISQTVIGLADKINYTIKADGYVTTVINTLKSKFNNDDVLRSADISELVSIVDGDLVEWQRIPAKTTSYAQRRKLCQSLWKLLWQIDPALSNADAVIKDTMPKVSDIKQSILSFKEELDILLRWLALSKELDISTILTRGISDKYLKPELINFQNEINLIKAEYRAANYNGRYLVLEIARRAQINTVRKLFQQVLRNLIDNAFKYSDANTAITVSFIGPVTPSSTSWELSVISQSSNPPGLDFKPLELRWRSEHSRGIPGDGMGLYIVNLLCKHMLSATLSNSESELRNGRFQYTFGVKYNE